MGFIDSYKHLEKICGEILDDERKVSAYIDEMLNTPGGSYIVTGWDDDLKQYYVEYKEGANTKKIWLEEGDSLKAKIGLINDNSLAGVASWAKDMETSDYWSFLKNEMK